MTLSMIGKGKFPLIAMLLVILTLPVALGQRTVSGTISDAETGEAIPGANVFKKGTTTGTISNLEGFYSIEVQQGDVLAFSFIGYITQEISITDQVSLDVLMQAEITELDEIVIIGYGKMRKSEVTGAIASVDVEEIQKMPVPSAAQAIQGRAAGVQVVQNSGAPGDGVSIKIRGTGTINNSEPLYVVDGVIVPDINNINPADIASTEILKDAASAAVYGSRAANGVVLITTKEGQSGKLQVNFSTYYALKEYWKTIQVMGPAEFDVLKNVGSGFIDRARIRLDENRTDNHTDYKDAVKDWVNEISRRGGIQKYNLSLTGGSDRITYYLSADYFNDKGMVIQSDYDRYNIISNISFRLRENLVLKTNLFYSKSDQNSIPEASYRDALRWSPLSTLRDNYGFLTDNPLTRITRVQDNRIVETGRMSLNLEWEITPHLTYTTLGSFQKTDMFRKYFQAASDAYNYNYGNYGSYNFSSYNYDNKWQWDNILSYDNSFEKHKLGAVAVVSMEGSWNEFMNGGNWGFVGTSPDLGYLSAGFSYNSAGGQSSSWTRFSGVARLTYSFDERYLVNAIVRADASSRFAEENRWGFFPSVSLGWRISEEKFWTPPIWVDMIKLRVNYGQNGNDRIGNYGIYTLLYPSMDYVYGSDRKNRIQSGWAPRGIANAGILWESVVSYNGGLDLNLFRSLYLTADYFIKDTRDMLLRIPIVPSSGMDITPYRNAGEVQNRGFEFSLEYRKNRQGFKYNGGLNFTWITNEVISLGQRNDPVWGAYGQDYFRTKTVVGYPIGMMYGWATDGLFTSWEQIEQSAQKDLAQPGDVRFMDLNADGVIDDKDRAFIGSPHPDILLGVNLGFDYRGFDFTAFLQGAFGNSVYNIMDYDLRAFHNTNAIEGSWNLFYMDYVNDSDPSDNRLINTEAELPRAKLAEGRNRNYRPSDFYVKDGSYLRIKNVQLGYSLPAGVTEKMRIQYLRIYIGALNLLTFTNYNGMDPEIGGADNLQLGFDNANYPQARTWQLGLNVSF